MPMGTIYGARHLAMKASLKLAKQIRKLRVGPLAIGAVF